MSLWISSNFWPLNLLLVQSRQADITITKRFIQGRNNVPELELSQDHVIRVVDKTTPLRILVMLPTCVITVVGFAVIC